MSEPSREELLDGLVQDAISVLHHDTTDDDVVDKYERDILRKKFLVRLRAAKPERERVIDDVQEAHKAFDRMLRNNVIEECAKLAERFYDVDHSREQENAVAAGKLVSSQIAASIRALKGTPA